MKVLAYLSLHGKKDTRSPRTHESYGTTKLFAVDNKSSHEPLFRDGFVDIDEVDIDKVFVSGNDTPKRRTLASGLRIFLAHLRSLGLNSYEIWIDGSFATRKPNPNDVDMVCFIPKNAIRRMPNSNLENLKYLGNEEGREYIRARWGCDYYHCPFDSIDDRISWKEKFSLDPNGTEKGIVRIKQ